MSQQQDKNHDGGKIKDKILSGNDAAKGKKKIVIKKKNVPQNKDISELFNKEQGKGDQGPRKQTAQRPAARPQGDRDGGPRGGEGGQNRPAQHRPGQPSQRPAGGQPNQTGGQDRGGAPRSPSRHVATGGQRSPIVSRAPRNEAGDTRQPRPGGPAGDRRGPGGPRGGNDRGPRPQGGGDRSFSGTPFDALVESSRRPSGGGGRGGRGGPPQGNRSGGGKDAPGVNPAQGEGVGIPAAGGAKTGGGKGGNARRGGDPRGRGGPGGTRRDQEEHFLNKLERKKSRPQSGTTVPKQIEIMETIQVGELAKKLNLKPSDVIARLMKMGEMVTINKSIDSDTATLLAGEYNCEVKVVSLYDETVIEAEADVEEDREGRPPVVTIMGHVDHGKTRLLDTIRKSNVIATEAGAITQHIGAYQVTTPGGKITFLDTPGHEAFTAMRARGAAVTDIVILVVAADDGVKEQTIEAITHAKEAEVPIIVAINKVDLPAANPDRVKQELVNHGLQPEDWGGSTIYCEISAKENIGIESLLEMVLLQAEVLDLRANSSIRAVGHVIEAKIDPGKGPVATILVEKGTLREGDPYVVGIFSGRVRAMFDDLGHRVKEAPPSTPVEITGIDGVPGAGDPFQVVESERYGREIAGKRHYFKQITDAASRQPPSLGDLHSWLQEHKELKIIIKADVQGSVEAIKDGLTKLSTDEVKVRVIHGATGAISESDVTLASASDALIVGFQVRATPRALELAEQSRVDIKYYSIIYKVIEDVQSSMEGMLEPDIVEEVTGKAEVRAIFKISRLGNIAGCMVKEGKIIKKNKIRIIRENVVIKTVDIKGLRRDKDDVGEVNEGFECGILLEGFNDLAEGDILECFEIKEVARKLGK